VNNWALAISIPLLPLLFYIEGKKGVAALPPLIPGSFHQEPAHQNNNSMHTIESVGVEVCFENGDFIP
jgi:hypothetical protein